MGRFALTGRLVRRLTFMGIGFVVPLLLFMQLADEVIEKEPLFLDKIILETSQSMASTFLTTFFQIITYAGDVLFILLATTVLIVVLYKKHRRQAALGVGLSVGGAALINLLLKYFFQRTRPDVVTALTTETSFSFPSGHAMASAALGLSLMLVFWHSRQRWLIAVLSVVYILLIGLSRVYLGVHYPSDIMAGYCVSAAWVTTVFVALEYPTLFMKPPQRLREN